MRCVRSYQAIPADPIEKREVVLNDECMHCNNRECHDGEHFCNQAMKDNSFYKKCKTV